ncbi:hypothetical protein Hanom_Chr07g00628741 [Helianthus anomalus]
MLLIVHGFLLLVTVEVYKSFSFIFKPVRFLTKPVIFVWGKTGFLKKLDRFFYWFFTTGTQTGITGSVYNRFVPKSRFLTGTSILTGGSVWLEPVLKNRPVSVFFFFFPISILKPFFYTPLSYGTSKAISALKIEGLHLLSMILHLVVLPFCKTVLVSFEEPICLINHFQTTFIFNILSLHQKCNLHILSLHIRRPGFRSVVVVVALSTGSTFCRKGNLLW